MGFFDKFNREMETSRKYRKAEADWKRESRAYDRKRRVNQMAYENKQRKKSPTVSLALVNKLGDEFNAAKYPTYTPKPYKKEYSSFHDIYEQAKKIASPEERNKFIGSSLTSYIHKQYDANKLKREKAEYELAQENFQAIENRRKIWEKVHPKKPEYEAIKKFKQKPAKKKTSVRKSYKPIKTSVRKSYIGPKASSLGLDYSKYGAEYRKISPLKTVSGEKIYDYPTQFGEGKLDTKKPFKEVKGLFNKIKNLFSNLKESQKLKDELKGATASAGVFDVVSLGQNKKDVSEEKLTGLGFREKYSAGSLIPSNDQPIDVVSGNIASSIEKLTGVNPKKESNFWGEYWSNLDTGDKFGLILGVGQPFIRDIIGAVADEISKNGIDKPSKEFIKDVIDKTISGEGKKKAYDFLNLKIGNFDIGDMIVDVVTDPVFVSSIAKGVALNVGKKFGKDVTKGIFKGISDFADNINAVNNLIYKPVEKSVGKAIEFLKNRSDKLWDLLSPNNFINNAIRSGKRFVDDFVDKLGAKDLLGDDGLKVLKKEYQDIQEGAVKHLSLYFEVKNIFKDRVSKIIDEVKSMGETLTHFANLMLDRDGPEHYIKTHPEINPKLVEIAKSLRKDLDYLAKKNKKIKYRKGYLPGTLKAPIKTTATPELNTIFSEYWLRPKESLEKFTDITDEQFLIHLTNRFAHQLGGKDLKVVGDKIVEFTNKLKDLVNIPEIIKDKLFAGINITKDFEVKFNKDLALDRLGRFANARSIIKKALEKELHNLVDDVKSMKLSMREVNRALFHDLPKGQLEEKSVIWDVVRNFQNKIDDIVKKVINDPIYNPKSDPDIYSKIRALGNEYKYIGNKYLGEIPKNISRNEFVSRVKSKLFYDIVKKHLDEVKAIKTGVRWDELASDFSKELIDKVPTTFDKLDNFGKVLFIDDNLLNKFSDFTYDKIAKSGLKFTPESIPHLFEVSINPIKKARVETLLKPLKVAGTIYDSALKLWKDMVLIGRGSAWATKNFIDDVVKPLIESIDSYLEGKPINLFTRSLKNAGNVTVDEILGDIYNKVPEKYYEKIIGTGLYDVAGNRYFSSLTENAPELIKKVAHIYDDVTGFMYKIFGKPEHITRLKYGTALLRSKLKELGNNYTEAEVKRVLNEVINGIDKVFFSYEKTPLDKGLEKVMPFFYWNRENLRYFGEKFAKYPFLLTQIVRFKDKLNKANEHLPLRVRDKIKIPIKQINDSLSGIGEIYINPISLFSVNFIDKFLREKPSYLKEKEALLEELRQKYYSSGSEAKKKLLLTYPELSEYLAYHRLSGVKKIVDTVDNLFGIYPLVRYMGEYVGFANSTSYKTVLPYTNLMNAIFKTHFGINPKNVEYQKESEKKAIKKLALIYDGDVRKAKEVYYHRKLLKELSGFLVGIFPEFLNKAEIRNYRLMQVAYGDDPVALKENYILRKTPDFINSVVHTGEDIGDGYYRLKADLIYGEKPEKVSYDFGDLYHLDKIHDFSEWIIDTTNRLTAHIPKVQNGELPTYEKIESLVSEPYKVEEVKKIPVVKKVINHNKEFFSNLVYSDDIQKANTGYKIELAKLNDSYINGEINDTEYEKALESLAVKYNVSDLAKKLISEKYMVVNSNSVNTKYNILYNDIKAGKIKTVEYLYNLMKFSGLIVNKDGYEISLVSKDRLKYLLNLLEYSKKKEVKNQFYSLRDQVYKLSDEGKLNEAITLLDKNKNQFIDNPKFTELYNSLIKRISHQEASKYFDLPDDEKVKVYEAEKSRLRELMSDNQFRYFSQLVESIKLKNKLNQIENYSLDQLTPELVKSLPDKYKWIVSKKIYETIKSTDNIDNIINKVSLLMQELPESEYEKILKPLATKYMFSWYSGKGMNPIKIKIGDKNIVIDDKYITLHYNSEFINQKVQSQLRAKKKELYPKYKILVDNGYDVDYVVKTKQLTKQDIDEISQLFDWVPDKIEESRKNKEYGMWISGLYKLPYKKRHDYYWKMPDWVREKFYKKFKFNY